jgi:hypothetical protein
MFLTFFLAFFLLAVHIITGQTLQSSETFPGGIIRTFSNGLQLLEVSAATDPAHPALNTSYLLQLRQASSSAELPQLPGVPAPIYLSKPTFGSYTCTTNSQSAAIKYQLQNSYDLLGLGTTWCCHQEKIPIKTICTVMDEHEGAGAYLCYKDLSVKVTPTLCVPCYAAGQAILQIAGFCQKNGKVEGQI